MYHSIFRLGTRIFFGGRGKVVGKIVSFFDSGCQNLTMFSNFKSSRNGSLTYGSPNVLLSAASVKEWFITLFAYAMKISWMHFFQVVMACVLKDTAGKHFWNSLSLFSIISSLSSNTKFNASPFLHNYIL